MGQLAGKVALITGASKGVGRVMSRIFAGEGAAVICAARSRDLVEETTALVKAEGLPLTPATVTLENFRAVFVEHAATLRAARNSVVLAASTALLTALAAVLLAYVLVWRDGPLSRGLSGKYPRHRAIAADRGARRWRGPVPRPGTTSTAP